MSDAAKVLKQIKDNDIKFVNWRFTDVHGKWQQTSYLASRVDARGVKLAYRYDDLGNLSRVEANDSTYQTAFPSWFSGYFAPDQVRRVDQTTSVLSELQQATAWSSVSPPSGALAVADNKFAYDKRGNLLTEWQHHGGAVVEATSPRIDYQRAFSAAPRS